jgi:AraC-like DNA-binding protein
MVQGAQLRTRRPVAPLAPFLGCYWWVDVAYGTRLRTFPDACTSVSVILHSGDSPESLFIGPRLVPSEGTPSIGHSLFGVRLKPGAAFLFTGTPVSAFAGERRCLEDILPQPAKDFETRIAQAATVDAHFDALEALMLERFDKEGSGIHACVQRALAIIDQTGGQIRIAELASRCHVSTRHLANLLRTWVGFSPKTLARITRFQKFLEQMETVPAESGAARAADLGYFDQAHLTREVSQFFGATPGSVSPHQVADFSKTRCE